MVPPRHLALVALLLGGQLACSEPSASPPAPGPPARASVSYRRAPELERESAEPVVVLWDAAGRPVRVRGAFASGELDHEGAARAFLERHASLFRLRPDGTDLTLTRTRQGLAGRYLRFGQLSEPPAGTALPVLEAEVVVLVADDAARTVKEVTLAQRPDLAPIAPAGDVGPDAALAIARMLAGHPREVLPPEVLRAIGGEPARVVYRVRLAAAEPSSAPEIVVDAATGTVLASRDRVRSATGSALVFDPNPVATTGDSTLIDDGDATTPTLDAARFAVSLENLDGSGFLRGNWVDARTQNEGQRALNAGLTFEYTRAEDGFEEAMAYYHLDRVQTRLQALGFTDVNARQQVAVVDGPNQDNSQYSPATLQIDYGSGGVDDAEDADVVLHEYGHAIQDDQVPGFGWGDAAAMGEGFGDYLAASLGLALSQQIDDPHCVAEWDATSYASGDPPCLRRTDVTAHYPEGEVNDIHDDGQMWSTALFALDQSLGADVVNSVVVESHFSLATNASYFVAAQSLLDADVLLFGGVHEAAIRRRLVQQGLCRILSPPSPLVDVIESLPVSIDNPRSGPDYVDDLDDTQSFSHPGAQALRLHFTTIDTEDDASCLDGGCDNLYLTGGDGDLYQFVHGQHTDVLSVAIPGDTVHLRLVTDFSITRPGYHVDRVDILGGGASGAGGSGGSGAGSVGGAGTGGDGVGGEGTGGVSQKAPTSADPESDSDCGCRVVGSAGDGSAAWLAAAFGLAAARRRRGRRAC